MIRRPPRSPLFPSPPLFRSPARVLDGVRGVVGADACDDGRAVTDRVEHRLEDGALLTVAQGGCLAGGAEHDRSEEHTSELQSRQYLVCRLLLEKKNINKSFS